MDNIPIEETSSGEMLSWSSCDPKRLALPVQVERHVQALPPVELCNLRGRETRSLEDVGCVEWEDDVRRGREFGNLAEGGEIEAEEKKGRGTTRCQRGKRDGAGGGEGRRKRNRSRRYLLVVVVVRKDEKIERRKILDLSRRG